MNKENVVLGDWSVVLDAIEEGTPASYHRALTILLERDTLDEAITTAANLRRIYGPSPDPNVPNTVVASILAAVRKHEGKPPVEADANTVVALHGLGVRGH